MQITKEWLQEQNACASGVKWFLKQDKTDSIEVLEALIVEEKFDDANWLIARVMDRKQQLQYAIYAAEQVLDLYEAKYPEDDRPRKAIEATKVVLENDTEENRDAARSADAAAAWAAAARAARAADAAAAWAAAAAAWVADAAAARAAADAAARAARAAADAAARAAARAADAADATADARAARAMLLKILKFGIEALEGEAHEIGEERRCRVRDKMSKKITKEWLQEQNACASGVKWFLKQDKTDSIEVLEALIVEEKFDDANWLIARVMDRKQRLQYAIYAAEQVLHLFEAQYPGDDRPRKAIEAAKAVLENDTEENRDAAWAAAADAWAAAAAADAAAARAADAAAWAADAVRAAADADAAGAAAWAAARAADAAADAAVRAARAAAAKETLLKILRFGIEALEGDRNETEQKGGEE